MFAVAERSMWGKSGKCATERTGHECGGRKCERKCERRCECGREKVGERLGPASVGEEFQDFPRLGQTPAGKHGGNTEIVSQMADQYENNAQDRDQIQKLGA